jgi:hypothetical protein
MLSLRSKRLDLEVYHRHVPDTVHIVTSIGMSQTYGEAVIYEDVDTHGFSILHLTPWSRVSPKKPAFPRLMKELTARTGTG